MTNPFIWYNRTQLSFEVLIGPVLGGPPERKEYFEYNAMLSIRTVTSPMC
jgi:hypothetical protein